MELVPKKKNCLIEIKRKYHRHFTQESNAFGAENNK